MSKRKATVSARKSDIKLFPSIGGPLFPSKCSKCRTVGVLYGVKAKRKKVGAALRYTAMCPICGEETLQVKIGPSWEERDAARKKEVAALVKRAEEVGHDFGTMPYSILCKKCGIIFSNVLRGGYPPCTK